MLRGTLDQDAQAQLDLATLAELDLLAVGSLSPDQEALLLGIRLTQADALQTLGYAEAARDLRLSEEARIANLPEATRAGMDYAYEAGRVAALVGDSLYWAADYAASLAAYDRAAAQFRAGLAAAPLNRQLLGGLHYAEYSRSAVLADLGDPVAGLAAAEASAAVAARLLDWDPTDILAQRLAQTSEGQIALMLRANGRLPEAIERVERQVAQYRALAAANPADGDAQRRVAVPMRGRAEMIMQAQGTEAGCVALREAQAAWAEVAAGVGLQAFDRDTDVAAIAAGLAQFCS